LLNYLSELGVSGIELHWLVDYLSDCKQHVKKGVLYLGVSLRAALLGLYFFIMVELTGEGRACIPVGLTKTWDGLVN